MKYSLIPFFILSLNLIACSSNKPTVTKSIYTFNYDGVEYEISSITVVDGDGANDLYLRNNDSVVFWARDLDQDGKIDQLIRNGISLQDANIIYQSGLAKAIEDGKFKDKTFQRTFHFETETAEYKLTTLFNEYDEPFNRLSVKPVNSNIEYVGEDIGSSGQIDLIIHGDISLEKIQYHYDLLITAGLQKGSITADKATYLVVRSIS